MKKSIFIIGLIFIGTFAMSSQTIADKTIGLRFGDANGLGAEVSFQKSLGDSNRLEAGLSWRNGSYYNAIKLAAIYQWVFDIENIEGLNWYVGAGGGFGSWKVKSDFTGNGGTYLFAAGDIGIDYKFSFPLLLSLDFRPEIGFADFNNDLGLDFALGVRYTFD
ncbi:MAG: hypothetical protein V3U80_04515 [Flavobacteriaceae bacterium]